MPRMSAIAALAAMLATLTALTGCMGGGGGTGGDIFIDGEIIKGAPGAIAAAPNDITARISVSAGHASVGDATVTVDGVETDVSGIVIFVYGYVTTTPPAIAAGDPVTVDIDCGAGSASADGTMPSAPVITAPAAMAAVDETLPLDITWAPVAPEPDAVLVVVRGTGTASGNDYRADLAGTATTHTVPANILLAGGLPVIEVRAIDQVTNFDGDAGGDSFVEIGHEAWVTVDTN